MVERITGKTPCPECGNDIHHISRGKPKRLPQLGTSEPVDIIVDLTSFSDCGHKWSVPAKEIKKSE